MISRIPLGQDVPGELGDPGTVTDLTAGFDGRSPGNGRNPQHGLVDGVDDGHPHQARQPPAARGEPVEELVAPPAVSVRTRVRRPRRYLFGSWASARRATSMWSAAVLLPTFPGRSRPAAGSPDPSRPWSTTANSG
jgi:hypothetical protein